jgi:hypothetical protein
MFASTLLLLAATAVLPNVQEATGRATVFRVDEVITLDGESLKNATVVIREGVIATMGEAAVVPDNAKVYDLRGLGSVISPPLVVASAGFLTVGSRRGQNSRFRAVQSLRLDEDWGDDLLEEGVLVLGVDPPGSGMPGRNSVLDASAEDSASDPLVADLHLKVMMSVGSNKTLLRKALEAADKAIAKEDKAREEWKEKREAWEKAEKEKAEAEKKAAEDKKKGDKPAAAAQEGGKGKSKEKGGKQEEEPPKEFVAPKMDPNVTPVVEWIRKERVAQVWMGSAADWLHWQDVMGDRELPYEIVLSPRRSTNLHEVTKQIAATGLRVHVPSIPTDRLFLPYTRIRINLPAELAEAGIDKLVLLPPGRSIADLRGWRDSVAQLVGDGLDRDIALRGMTLEAAASLGQEERIAALTAGGPANFVVWSGDPLASMSEALYVVADGETVYDRERAEEEEER